MMTHRRSPSKKIDFISALFIISYSLLYILYHFILSVFISF